MGTISLATGVYRPGGFWNSYALDMAGPAWNYILIRGLFARNQRTPISSFFTPLRALLSVVGVCLVVEFMQFLELYESKFDAYDLAAYVSVVIPCFAADTALLARKNRDAPNARQRPRGASDDQRSEGSG